MTDVPRTVEFEQVHWDSDRPVYIESVSGIVAISADGPRMNMAKAGARSIWGTPLNLRLVQSIYTLKPHVAYLIDHQERSIVTFPCTCEIGTDENPPPDAECSKTAKRYYPNLVRSYSDVINGFSVVTYRRLSVSRFSKVALAPSLECEVIEETETVFGFGEAKSYQRYRVTSYKAGEPLPGTFIPPGDYQPKPAP